MSNRRSGCSAAARAVAVALLMLLALPPAWAHAPKIGAAAADHVAAANRAYQAKNYDKALEELRAGYRLAPRAEFLLTFAQIYRAAGKLQQALEACNSYLATMPNGSLAPGARELADALRDEINAATPAPTPPPVVTTPPPVAPPPVVVTPPVDTPPAVDTPPPLTVTTSPPPRARHRKALAWGLGVGAVILVGAAVGLGLGLTLGRERSSTFGDVKFNP